MSASLVLPSTDVHPTNQERPTTMTRMPQFPTTTSISPRWCGRRQVRRLNRAVAAGRALRVLCVLLVVAGLPVRAASQTQPAAIPTPPASSPALAVDVAALDPKIVSGASASLGQALVESAGTTSEIVEFYGYDAIGSVRVVFDVAGTVVGEAAYAPFGIEMAGATGMPSQRFTGQERDHEAQLDHFNARSYQSRTGRFSSPDPLFDGALANPQRWNRYAYALNNPLSHTDTSGLLAENTDNRAMELLLGHARWTGDFGFNIGWTDSASVTSTSGGFGPEFYLNMFRRGGASSGGDDGGMGLGRGRVAAAFPALVIPAIPAISAATVETGAAIVAGAALAAAIAKKVEGTPPTHITYTLVNAKGQTYIGRTAGWGAPTTIMKIRFYGHEMRVLGYGDPQLDVAETGWRDAYQLIRGREQQWIDEYGGASWMRDNPRLGNKINGISGLNPFRTLWVTQAREKWGPVPVVSRP